MAAPGVRTLLEAVRRRLWWLQLGAAVRRAAWGTAGVALLAALVHAVLRPVSVEALAWTAALLWGASLAWAAGRRPNDAVCALWADRRLGGTSAFTTWLEMEAGTPTAAQAAAVRWLGHWATERVPASLRLLAQQPAPAHLFRPLLSMLACTALATLVLTLPQLAPAPAPPASASAASPGVEPVAALAQASGPAPQVSQIESALRAAKADADAAADAEAEFGRGEGGRAPAAGPSRADDASPTAVTEPGAAPPSQTPPGRASPAGAPAAAAAAGATGQTVGASTGREAGDSPDLRAEVGVSRAQGGTIPVQRSTSGLHDPASGRRADMDQQAQYDDELHARAAAAGAEGPAPAAATPPAASDATRLTRTETSYVQAWMKASGRRR
jgi:hypothetical protein